MNSRIREALEQATEYCQDMAHSDTPRKTTLLDTAKGFIYPSISEDYKVKVRVNPLYPALCEEMEMAVAQGIRLWTKGSLNQEADPIAEYEAGRCTVNPFVADPFQAPATYQPSPSWDLDWAILSVLLAHLEESNCALGPDCPESL